MSWEECKQKMLSRHPEEGKVSLDTGNGECLMYLL